MPGSVLGNAVRRVEDPDLLAGPGRSSTTSPRGCSVDALEGADVVRGRFENQRMAFAPMEGNAIAVISRATAPARSGRRRRCTTPWSTR